MMTDDKTTRVRAKETSPRKPRQKLTGFCIEQGVDETEEDYRRRYSREFYHYKKTVDPDFLTKCSAKTKAYNARYPERVAARKLDYCERNRESEAERARKWIKANPERGAEARKTWRENNRELVAENGKRWKAKNIDLVKSIQHAQRARNRTAGGRFTADDLREIDKAQKGKCALCRVKLKGKSTVDHIMPLALGGTNDRRNIQLLCAFCNQSKGARHPLDHARKRGLLL